MAVSKGEKMKLRWVLFVSTACFVGSLLLGTVAEGQVQAQVSQSGDVARGKTLFLKYCTGCHGPEGEADRYRFVSGPDPANLTLPRTSKKSDVDLLKTIHDGTPNMPPWKTRLSEKERRDVLAYVRTLSE